MPIVPPVITYPTPVYQNLPIEPQYYQPSQFYISNVSIGTTTTVTTAVNHNYVVSQLVRLLIPKGYGCTQLNEQLGYVIQVPAANQVVININSQNANAFISANLSQKPQIVAVGEINTGPINANGSQQLTTFIPGSFINISPV